MRYTKVKVTKADRWNIDGKITDIKPDEEITVSYVIAQQMIDCSIAEFIEHLPETSAEKETGIKVPDMKKSPVAEDKSNNPVDENKGSENGGTTPTFDDIDALETYLSREATDEEILAYGQSIEADVKPSMNKTELIDIIVEKFIEDTDE